METVSFSRAIRAAKPPPIPRAITSFDSKMHDDIRVLTTFIVVRAPPSFKA